jgi:hypothetical protein
MIVIHAAVVPEPEKMDEDDDEHGSFPTAHFQRHKCLELRIYSLRPSVILYG